MRTRQARQPDPSTRDEAAAPPLDLDSLPSITLTASMVSYLMGTIQHEGPASSPSSSAQPARRTPRKKAAPAKSSGPASTSSSLSAPGGPLREHGKQRSTTEQPKQTSTGNTTADDDNASLDTDGRDSAAGVTRRTCSHCGRLFKRASDCRRHERIHTNDKPHPCPVPDCGKAFVQKSALTTHLRTHTGEKPYTCRKGDCSRIFADASSRKKHESTHDKDDKRYPCPVCPKQAFRRRDTLTLHMKRMHPEVAFAGFSDDPEAELDMTSEADAYATSEMDADVGEREQRLRLPDEESLLHFSSEPTDHSFTSETTSDLPPLPPNLSYSVDTAFAEYSPPQYGIGNPLNRSQSAPVGGEHLPTLLGHSRAPSAPIQELPIQPSGSMVDIASLFFDSSASGSASSSSQSSFSTRASNDRHATSASSRYPFTYNAAPLIGSLQGHHSDGENDRILSRNTGRPSTSSAEDLFELLYTPPAPRVKSGQLVSQLNHIHNRTAPQARQPLSRVPSFGTPWAPGSPPKGQQAVLRELNDMFT